MLLSFCLPLASKINIVKCFILSQLCYLAPIIVPSEAQIAIIEKAILRFLYPRQSTISASRTFSPVSKGGLGLPPVKLFLKSLRIKFSIKAASSSQPWAKEVKLNFPGNNICKQPFPNNQPIPTGSITHRHIHNCTELQKAFYSHDKRCWTAPIFGSIFSDYRSQPFNIMNPPAEVLQSNILQAKILDMINFENNCIKPYGECLATFNAISFNLYFHARNATRQMLNRYNRGS